MHARTDRPERRTITTPVRLLALRAEGDAAVAAATPGRRTVTGHAAVFDQWTILYSGKMYDKTYTWREILRPGAFKNAIAEAQDVRALWNHNPDFVLGRTASGTCRLSEDATGLATEIDLSESQIVNDLVAIPMGRGDVTQMSFAFKVRKGGERVTIREEGDQIVEERELLDLDLFDVSPVAYPAYEGTDCSIEEEGRERCRVAVEARRRPDPAHGRRVLALKLMPKF